MLEVRDREGIGLYEQLRQVRGVQWPAPDFDTARAGGTPRRYMHQEGWKDQPYENFRRITSYNVCYTKLLRARLPDRFSPKTRYRAAHDPFFLDRAPWPNPQPFALNGKVLADRFAPHLQARQYALWQLLIPPNRPSYNFV